MRVSRIHLGIIAAVAAVVLTGCASASNGDTDAATDSPAPTGETSQEPEVSASVDASEEPDGTEPDDDAWWITGSAVGPIELGADFDTVAAELTADGWTTGCPGLDPEARILWGSVDGVDWTVAAAFDEATGERSDVIGTIALSGETGQTTEEGLGLGSPLDDVIAAYPDATAVESYGQGYTGYTVTDGDATTYWGTQSGDVVTSVMLTTQSSAPMEFCG